MALVQHDIVFVNYIAFLAQIWRSTTCCKRKSIVLERETKERGREGEREKERD